MSAPVRLSVVVPVRREPADVAGAFAAYHAVLGEGEPALEFIYVVDGPLERSLATLKSLRRAGQPIEILAFAQPMGEAAALAVAFAQARGEAILTLTAEAEVAPGELPRLLAGLAHSDMVIACRRREPPPPFGTARKFDTLMRLLFGTPLHDIRCGVRALRAPVAKELVLYGNQHNFLPLLAQSQGFTVREIEVAAVGRAARGRAPWRIDLSLGLDVLTVYFVLKFLKKPFRFFGGIGFAVLAAGALYTLWLVAAKLLFGVALADRPALILSTLMVVLGIQIIAVGLIGEIITFAYARELKDYRVDRIAE